MVWVAALLAALLVMDRLFRDDWQDGSLEQLMLLPTPLVAVVLVKVVAHWMMSGLPLLIVSPLAALLLGMSLHDAGVLALTLLLGTPTLSFLGAAQGCTSCTCPGAATAFQSNSNIRHLKSIKCYFISQNNLLL